MPVAARDRRPAPVRRPHAIPRRGAGGRPGARRPASCRGPDGEPHPRLRLRCEPRVELLAAPEIEAVDVDVVVPVVERRLDRARQGAAARAPTDRRCRSARSGRRAAASSRRSIMVSAVSTSSVPQPVNRSRPTGHIAAAGRRVGVVGAPLEQPRDLLGAEHRILAEQQRRRGRDLRSRERRADRVPELERPAVRVRPVEAAGRRVRPGWRGMVEKIVRPGAEMSL